MNNSKVLVLFFASLLTILPSCDNSSDLELETLVPVKTDIKVGLYPNRILLNGDYAYIVNSGDNTVGRLDLATFDYDNNFIILPQDTNPYALAVMDNHLLVSSVGRYSGDYIVSFDLDSLEEEVLVEDLFMVSDLRTSNSCVNFIESEYDYSVGEAEGKLTTLCSGLFSSVKTDCSNPATVRSQGKSIYISCSGVYEYDSSYNISGTEGSGVCIYKDSLELETCLLEGEDTGTISLWGDSLLVGSTFSGVLTIVSGDKIETNLIAENTMINPYYLKDDKALLLDFNNSKVYLYNLIDKEIEVSYNLSETELDKRGSIDLAYDSSLNRVYILNTLSSTVDIFDL